MVASNIERARESLTEERQLLEGNLTRVNGALEVLGGPRNGTRPTNGRVARGALTRQILELAATGPFRPNDQFAAVGSSKASVANAAHRMMRQGRLEKVAPGTYRATGN